MKEADYLAQLRTDEQEALDAFWPPKKKKKGKSWHKKYCNYHPHRRCWRRK